MTTICEYCDKSFSNKSNAIKHQRAGSCAGLNGSKVIESDDSLLKVYGWIAKMQCELKTESDLRKQMQQEIVSLKQMITQSTQYSTTITNSGNQLINSNNNNNTVNIVNVVNNFGKEEVTVFTNEILKQLVPLLGSGVIEYARLRHCNPENPRNRNVRIQSRKRKEVVVMQNGKWVQRDLRDTLTNIAKKSLHTLGNFFEDNEDEFRETPEYRRMDTYFTKARSQDKDTMREAQEGIYNMLVTETAPGAGNRPPDEAIAPPEPDPLPFVFTPDMSPSSHPRGLAGYQEDLRKYHGINVQ